jgi:hypothetical protein
MLRSSFAAASAAFLMVLGGPATADEGMWPFDEAPLTRVKTALGVNLDSHWLDHLRSASVRLTSGCSASIVSREGLVLTNQHCIVSCAEQLSTGEADYLDAGFSAAGPAQERTCPGEQAEVLIAIIDVTNAIFAAGHGKFGEDYATSREAAIAAAESQACGGDSRFRCQVISFYQGGQFKVYKYRRYNDVRLGVRAGVRRRFLRRRPGQLQLSALRPRLRVPAPLRRRQAGRDAGVPRLEHPAAGGRRAGVRLRQPWRHRAPADGGAARDAP